VDTPCLMKFSWSKSGFKREALICEALSCLLSLRSPVSPFSNSLPSRALATFQCHFEASGVARVKVSQEPLVTTATFSAAKSRIGLDS
jgi:hypothetical protein